MELLLGNRRVRLDPRRTIGRGGEAEVYDLGDGRALKVFKDEQHPDLLGDPAGQAAARARLELQQRKLPAFPAHLPERVVAPEELAFLPGPRGQRGPVAGYTMRLIEGAEPLLRWGEPAFRRTGGTQQEAQQLLTSLLRTLGTLHRRGVVVGDLNDLNVLVRTPPGSPALCELIDTDSFQFGAFPCGVFTERFLDPRLCDQGQLLPVRPFDCESDWFAFGALLVQTFLWVGPWGGVHRPTQGAPVPQRRRALERVSIFRDEVQLPRAALPRELLPDDLLHELHQLFERDQRHPLPAPLLEGLDFQTCPACGLSHARPLCPRCAPLQATRATAVTAARGDLTAQTLFETRGVLLAAEQEGENLRLVFHEDAVFRREGGRELLRGERDPQLRILLLGESSAVARGGQLLVLGPDHPPVRLGVDVGMGEPLVASCGETLAWVHQGQLFAEGLPRLTAAGQGVLALAGARQPVGEVLARGSRLFLGPGLGLGITRAGALNRVFTFAPGRRGLHEQVDLPRLPGELCDVRCAFGDGRAFLFLALRHQGRTELRLFLFDAAAHLLAEARGEEGDESFLEAMPEACATGSLLLLATERGLCRVEQVGRRLLETRRFPESASFVDRTTRLSVTAGGLLAAGPQRLLLLRLAA